MTTKPKLKPGTAGTVEGDRHAYEAIMRLEALVDAARHFDDAREEADQVMASSHLTTTLGLIEEQFDALRVALWGEGRSP